MSATPLTTQLSIRVVQLLGDGKWHDAEKTFNELSKLVPPGPAIRRNEKDRRNYTSNGKGRPYEAPPQRVRQISEERRIASGARSLVREFLKNDAFEFDRAGTQRIGGNHGRRIRMLRPPRAALGDAARVVRDQQAYQIEVLREEVTKLMKYLVDIGHSEQAEALLSPAYRRLAGEVDDEDPEY